MIPGLVEAHIHLSYNDVKAIADLDLNCPPEISTLRAAKNGELALHCGYTAARSAGAVHRIDAALKQAFAEGLYPGPRLLAASRDICATGGMADWNPSYLKLGMEGLALIADGPEQIRAAVRRSIKDGADVVKCYVGGDALLPHTPIGDCTYTLPEVAALVDESRMRGRMTAAHVRGQQSSRVAAQAGVDSLEHATYADDETLRMIADKGLTLVPGLRYLYSIIENGPRFGIDEAVIAPSGLRDEIKQAADTYRRARELGIRMCPGGDFRLRLESRTASTPRTSRSSWTSSATPRSRPSPAPRAAGRSSCGWTTASGRCKRASSPTWWWSTAIRSATSPYFRTAAACPSCRAAAS